MISFKIGTKTKTDVVLAYIDGLADPKVIDKAKKRIKKIKIDAVLESGYIEEFIEDDTYSPFPQLQSGVTVPSPFGFFPTLPIVCLKMYKG